MPRVKRTKPRVAFPPSILPSVSFVKPLTIKTIPKTMKDITVSVIQNNAKLNANRGIIISDYSETYPVLSIISCPVGERTKSNTF